MSQSSKDWPARTVLLLLPLVLASMAAHCSYMLPLMVPSPHTHSAPSAATPSPHIVSLTHCAGHVAHVGYSRVPFEGIWGVWEIRSSRASHFQLEHGGVVRLYPRVAGYTKQRYYHPACLRLPASTTTTTATTTTTTATTTTATATTTTT